MSTQNPKNPKVDAFIERSKSWTSEYKALREIALSCDLTEDLKWGVPCYTLKSKNIVLIHGFNEYCAILFPKGALLTDPDKLLIQQTEHVQAARQMRFKTVEDITEIKENIRNYILEAVKNEQAGLKVDKRKTEYVLPEELQSTFKEKPGLKTAFEALTPGRQRAYLLHFSGAKQSKTRIARIEKHEQRIMQGKGLTD